VAEVNEQPFVFQTLIPIKVAIPYVNVRIWLRNWKCRFEAFGLIVMMSAIAQISQGIFGVATIPRKVMLIHQTKYIIAMPPAVARRVTPRVRCITTRCLA
jgi:hypothetical protein